MTYVYDFTYVFFFMTEVKIRLSSVTFVERRNIMGVSVSFKVGIHF